MDFVISMERYSVVDSIPNANIESEQLIGLHNASRKESPFYANVTTPTLGTRIVVIVLI